MYSFDWQLSIYSLDVTEKRDLIKFCDHRENYTIPFTFALSSVVWLWNVSYRLLFWMLNFWLLELFGTMWMDTLRYIPWCIKMGHWGQAFKLYTPCIFSLVPYNVSTCCFPLHHQTEALYSAFSIKIDGGLWTVSLNKSSLLYVGVVRYFVIGMWKLAYKLWTSSQPPFTCQLNYLLEFSILPSVLS